MVYGVIKDWKRRRFSDKVLRDKVFNITKNPKYNGYQRRLASMIYKFFDKKSTGSRATTLANKSAGNHEIKQNIQFSEELHQPINRNFKKRTVYSKSKENIWGDDLADVQLISKFNKEFRFLLYFIDIFSKNTWIVPLKDKRGVSIINPL